MKQRIQQPKVHERTDRKGSYWFFRYWHDEVLPDGSIKTTRKFHRLGPSKGKGAMTEKRAQIERDRFLAEQNAAALKVEPVVAASEPAQPEPGDNTFGELAEMWRRDYVEKIVAGRPLIAKPTREKYSWCLERTLPRWGDVRLNQIRSKDVLDWLQAECTSWHAMVSLRNAMSAVITKAQDWEILPETFSNPIRRVRMPKKWEVREKRILSEDETALVLAHLEEPNLLICETCLDTGTRISEVTGLMIKHVDLKKGTIMIAQRNWRGDIDDPKTKSSKRLLALGALTPRYEAWIAQLKHQGPNAWVFPRSDDHTEPRWDSGVRQALKKAARAIKPEGAAEDDPGLDFLGFGPHSLRRANITWRQEVGGSSIEASKIAGHSSTEMTGEYTVVGLRRQDELTRRIQQKRAKATKKANEVVEIKKKETAA